MSKQRRVSNEGFRWADDARGERIEAMVHRLTVEHPFLMRSVLANGITGSLGSWVQGNDRFGGGLNELAAASCGCFVGSVAIAARNAQCLMPGIDATLELAVDSSGWSRLSALPVALAKALDADDRDFQIEMDRVGLLVSEEGDAEGFYEPVGDWSDENEMSTLRPKQTLREADVSEYLEELIQVDLLLLGFRNV